MDGQDLKLLDPLTFRRHLGIVPQVGLDTRSEVWLLSGVWQDCSLFNDTISYELISKLRARSTRSHEQPKAYNSLSLLPGFNIRYGRSEATDAEAAPSLACTDVHPCACIVMYAYIMSGVFMSSCM